MSFIDSKKIVEIKEGKCSFLMSYENLHSLVEILIGYPSFLDKPLYCTKTKHAYARGNGATITYMITLHR